MSGSKDVTGSNDGTHSDREQDLFRGIDLDLDPTTAKSLEWELMERKQESFGIQMKNISRKFMDRVKIGNFLKCTSCRQFPLPKQYVFCTNVVEAHILCKACFRNNSLSSNCKACIPCPAGNDHNSEFKDRRIQTEECGKPFCAGPKQLYEAMLKNAVFQCANRVFRCDWTGSVETIQKHMFQCDARNLRRHKKLSSVPYSDDQKANSEPKVGLRDDMKTCSMPDLRVEPTMRVITPEELVLTSSEYPDELEVPLSELMEDDELPRLEELPSIPIQTLLTYLDGVSAVELKNASTTLFNTVSTCLSGRTGTRYWTERCKSWIEDFQLMGVLASYDTIVNRDKYTLDELAVKEAESQSVSQFSWDYCYRSAHDLVTFIRCGDVGFFRVKSLEMQIKRDILFKYGIGRDRLAYDCPNRVTGTSGTLAWNLMSSPQSEDNPENLAVYENMLKCRRIVNLNQGQITRAQVMVVARERSQSDRELEDFNNSQFPLVSRFLLTVGENDVCLVPLSDEGPFFRAEPPPYSFKAANCPYMTHKVAVYENYFAVWSDPYAIRIYSVHVNEGGVSRYSLYATLPNYPMLGKVWLEWSKLEDDCAYIFSLGPSSPSSSDSLTLSVTCPMDPKRKMYRVFIKRPTPEADNPFSPKTEDLEFYPDIQSVPSSLVGPVSAHGLHIYWSSSVLAASANGVKWFFQEWNGIVCSLTSDPESFDVSLIETIAPNLLALVSGEDIYIATINLNPPAPATPTSIPSLKPYITMELIRKIRTGFFQRVCAIRQLHLDYDRGIPYIWIVVDKVCHPSDPSSHKLKDKPWSFQFYRIKFMNNK